MTYKERILQEHPQETDLPEAHCPSDFGLKNSVECPFYGGWAKCSECWDREMKENE